MYFGLLIAGLVFLFNPYVSVADVLPDVIGCIFIVFSLRRLEHISPDVKASREAFTKLGAVSLIKMLCLVFVLVLRSTDSGLSLGLSLGCLIAELVFLFTAFGNLLTGVSYLSSRAGKEAEYSDGIKAFKIYSYIFFTIRAVLTMLPELANLVSDDEALISGKTSFFAENKTYLNIGNVIICLLLGAVWLYLAVSLCNTFKRDKAFCEFAHNEYEINNPGEKYWFTVSQKRALSLVGASALLLINIYADGKSIIPDTFSFLLMSIALFVFYKNGMLKNKSIFAVSLSGIAVSTAEWICSLLNSDSYYAYEDFFDVRSISTDKLYIPTIILQIISSLLLIVAFSGALYCCYKTVDEYFRTQNSGLIGREHDKNIIYRNKLHRKMGVCVFLTFALAITKVLYFVFLFNFTEFWMIDFAVALLYGVLLSSVCSDIKQGF